MRRAVATIALASAFLASAEARAQGIIDLFGPDNDRPAARQSPPRPARNIPRVAEPKRAEAKPKKRETGAPAATKDAGKTAPVSGEAPPPPYEAQLVRLSELLGSLAYLRDLCGAKDGDDWRGKMSTLLDAEAPNGPRRDRYVAAFNRGFRGYELTYRVCTPNAAAVTNRYLEETAKITRDVTYRFGSP